ncbi:MAG: type II toxin-antitoxin system HicB family antitoxin [Oscillospiraceae bacterium]|nr:type II toxin-antitoxin system HicB family antitoxin [Oscillospiraceae bacterium]
MKVIYPVLFYEEKNGAYSVFVPDFNNTATSGNTLEEAMYMAEDLIAGLVLDKIEEDIPSSSKISDVSFEELEEHLEIDNWEYVAKFKTYIMVDVAEFAKKWGKESVKKTLSIPKWLNTKAERLGVNFSKVLQEALLEKITKV